MSIFEKRQQFSGTGPKKAPTPPPPKPKTVFEERREWSRIELERRMRKAAPYIPGTGGKLYTRQEQRGMLGRGLEKLLPSRRFKSHISELEARKTLRELRKQEYQAKTGAEKLKLSRERRWLERTWGLKGKY